jgi:hypothetical protein
MMAKTTTRCVSREDRRKISDLALIVHKKRREDRLEIVGDMTGKDSLRTSHDAFLPEEKQEKKKHKQPPPDQSREDQETPMDQTTEKPKNQTSPKG